MVSYTLKAKKEFLKNAGGSIDIIVEGDAVFGILTDDVRFPETKKSIREYTISVKNNQIKFELEKKLKESVYRSLSNYWDIKEK